MFIFNAYLFPPVTYIIYLSSVTVRLENRMLCRKFDSMW